MKKRFLLCALLLAIGCGGGGGGGGAAAAVTPPTAPTAVATAVLSATSIRVTWVDNASNEDGFTVEYVIPPATTFQTAGTASANTTQFTHTGLTASTNYTYRVNATNAGGSTTSTNQANGTTSVAPTTAPTAPSTLAAQATSSTQINLTWVDNASNEDGCKIERSTSATSGFTQIDTVNANVTAYSATGLTASTQYYFRVRAYNTVGDSSYSNTATGTTLPAGGGTWVEQTLPATFQTYNFTSIAGSSVNDIFVGGTTGSGITVGHILHKDATNWTEHTLPIAVTSVGIAKVFAANDAYAFAYTWNGTANDSSILHWDGASWSQAFQKNSWTMYNLFALSATNIYFVGSGGVIIHYNGTTWTQETSGTTTDLYGVWASSTTDVFVVGGSRVYPSSNPVILHSANGSTWSSHTVPSGVTAGLISVVGVSGSNVVAVGDGGAIIRYDGATWTKETSGTSDTVHRIVALSPNAFIATSYTISNPFQGSLRQSSGSTWTSRVTTPGASFAWVGAISSTNAFATSGVGFPANSPGAIYHYDGTNWPLEFQTRALVAGGWAASPSDIWAAGYNGLILRRQ